MYFFCALLILATALAAAYAVCVYTDWGFKYANKFFGVGKMKHGELYYSILAIAACVLLAFGPEKEKSQGGSMKYLKVAGWVVTSPFWAIVVVAVVLWAVWFAWVTTRNRMPNFDIPHGPGA